MIGTEGEVDSSTVTEIDQPERKLDMRKKREAGKLKERDLEIKLVCQTMSETFEISRAMTEDFLKSLGEDDLTLITYERISLVDLTW